MTRTLLFGFAMIMVTGGIATAQTVVQPVFAPGNETQWTFVEGDWKMGEGTLAQISTDGGTKAILTASAFSDVTITFEANVKVEGPGVRAAAVLFRASGTMSYYWLHLDTRSNNVILVRSTPGNSWGEIARAACNLPDGEWFRVKVDCIGETITTFVNDQEVLRATDPNLKAGYVGLGTSQGSAEFRNLKIEGVAAEMPETLKDETPPHKVISRGQAAGSYQAFPDACRMLNGDIIAVFYAGYGHVSVPTDEWPKGGRICTVRSSDEGRTWTAPEILFDDDRDNRDPHIAQLKDGRLVCTFFSLMPKEGGGYKHWGAEAVFSNDGGKTWDTTPVQFAPEPWVCSAPVREMPDGTLLLGTYRSENGYSYGGVARSTDGGKTWSEPVPIGREKKLNLDAETDVILCRDGILWAALRSSSVNMHYATSTDMGLTWSPAYDIGFKGHAPHLYRLSTDVIVMTQRVPQTSMYISRDECRTWQGPYLIDTVGGAYPATVELKDGTILVIYYEEGSGSAVRVKRFRVKADGLETLGWD